MKNNRTRDDKTEYDTFSDALKKVLSVPRAEMIKMLAQEKASKKSHSNRVESARAFEYGVTACVRMERKVAEGVTARQRPKGNHPVGRVRDRSYG